MSYSERHLDIDARKKGVWPDNKKMAVTFYVAAEEYQWESVEEVPSILSRNERPPSLSVRTGLKYGFDFGIPRLLEVLKKNDTKCSFFTSGIVATRHPELTKEIAHQGHEIVAHAFSQETHMARLSETEQRSNIRTTLNALKECTGKLPTGWDSPYASCNEDTMKILAEEALEYNADLQDDELPYLIDWKGKTMVELPHQRVFGANDYGLFTSDAKSPPSQTAIALKAIFDVYHAESVKRPLMWRFGVHPYLGGKPECAYVIDDVLGYLRSFDDVWMPTLEEVAKWWAETFGKIKS